jgi:hypothetical protein
MNNVTELIQSGQGEVKTLPLNLAIALVDQKFNISGTQICLWDAPNQTDVIYLKFNGQSKPAIPFRRGKIIRTPFTTIHVSVPGTGAGTATIAYGTGDTDILSLLPNVSEASEVLEDIRDELQGDTTPDNWGNVAVGLVAVQVAAANADRNSIQIQAALGNTQTVWIGYANTVTNLNAAGSCPAGRCWWRDDYRGAVWAIAGGAGQVVHLDEV